MSVTGRKQQGWKTWFLFPEEIGTHTLPCHAALTEHHLVAWAHMPTGMLTGTEKASIDLDLSGRTALVTGSSRGIGYATLRGLADLRARAVLHGRTAGSVERGLKHSGSNGRMHPLTHAWVTSPVPPAVKRLSVLFPKSTFWSTIQVSTTCAPSRNSMIPSGSSILPSMS